MRKYYLPPKYIMVLWFGVAIGALSIILMTVILSRIIYLNGYLPVNSDTLFALIITLLSVLVIFLWRKVTFAYGDVRKLMKAQGVERMKKRSFSLWALGVYRFYYGRLDGIYIGAKIDSPILAFNLSRYQIQPERLERSPALKKSWQNLKERIIVEKDIPGYMEQESQIDFMFPVRSNYDIDVKFAPGGGSGTLPETSCLEIDLVLRDALKDTAKFRGRIVLNATCFRMTVVGGSWQGRLFGENILYGVGMVKAIHAGLTKRFPVSTEGEWDISWDDAGAEFRFALEETAQKFVRPL